MKLGIGCVVEGQGEQEAVPELMRRIVTDLFGFNLDLLIPKPVRVNRNKIVRRNASGLSIDSVELSRATTLAFQKARSEKTIVVVLLDADEDLPCIVAPLILEQLNVSHNHVLKSVVLPTREFEAWIIAGIDSLKGRYGIPDDIVSPPNPELIKNPKAWLRGKMGGNYRETVDQAKLASQIDLKKARRAHSFDKLHRDVERMISGLLTGS